MKIVKAVYFGSTMALVDEKVDRYLLKEYEECMVIFYE
jgi:hypothetical protein